jgi:hypothetical protein
MHNFFFIIIFALIAYTIAFPNGAGTTHTIYTLTCHDAERGASDIHDCEEGKISADKVTFLAIPEVQKIVIKNIPFAHKYQNCTVFDARNWWCNPDQSKRYSYIMSAGRYVSNVESEKKSFRTISYFEYLKHKIIDYLDL